MSVFPYAPFSGYYVNILRYNIEYPAVSSKFYSKIFIEFSGGPVSMAPQLKTYDADTNELVKTPQLADVHTGLCEGRINTPRSTHRLRGATDSA